VLDRLRLLNRGWQRMNRLYLSVLLGTILLPSVALGDVVIDRFVAVPDCIFPDPRARILSYQVSGGVTRVRIDALHRGGRVRTFHSTPGYGSPSFGASGVQDPGATSDVESYSLVVTGEGGVEVRRVLPFRYRHARFELVPPASHTRITSGSGRVALYQSLANVADVDSLSCSFKFDAPISGESGRAGTARIAPAIGPSGGQVAVCEVHWSSVRKAKAGGTVEWTARVTDQCTQGRITRTARINPIH
jgi:hypothetical protein